MRISRAPRQRADDGGTRPNGVRRAPGWRSGGPGGRESPSVRGTPCSTAHQALRGCGTTEAAPRGSGGLVGQFLVGTATGPEGPPRRRRRRRARADYASGSQFVEVGQTLSGKSVEQVGLGGADAGRGSLGACAKSAAGSHAGHRTGSTSPTTPAAGIVLQEQCAGPGLQCGSVVRPTSARGRARPQTRPRSA